MTRQSRSKVGPREDEQRAHEEQPLVDGTPVEERDDRRRQRAPGDGEPDPSPGLRPLSARPAGDQPSIDDAYAIADFGRWCEPSWFPIPASDLHQRLDAAGAPAWIVARVGDLDPGTVVESPRDAWLRSRR